MTDDEKKACFDEALKECFDEALEALFDEALDDSFPAMEIHGLTFPASRVLKELDPVAYNESLADWLNGLVAELEE